MKKKSFFLIITCFCLCSAVALFFIYQQHLSEITENKGVKNNNKENDNDKENDNLKEEDDDLPWLLNWKGATLSLVASAFIMALMVKVFFDDGYSSVGIVVLTCIVIFSILFFGLFPIFFAAISEYKDKSFNERYHLLWQSYWKPFVYGNLNFLLIYSLCKQLINKIKNLLLYLLSYFF